MDTGKAVTVLRNHILGLALALLCLAAPAAAEIPRMPSAAFFAAFQADDGEQSLALIKPDLVACVDEAGETPDRPEAMGDCYPLFMFAAQSFLLLGQHEEAMEQANVAVQLAENFYPAENYAMAGTRFTRATILISAERYQESVGDIRAAIRLVEALDPPDEELLLDYRTTLGLQLVRLRSYAEAVPLIEAGIAGIEDPTIVPSLHQNLGIAYGALLKFDKAETAYRTAIAQYDALGEVARPFSMQTRGLLAQVLALTERKEEALAAIEPVVAYWRTKNVPQELAGALTSWSTILEELERKDEALAAMREALGLSVVAYGEEHEATVLLRRRLAALEGQDGAEDKVEFVELPEQFWVAQRAGDFRRALDIGLPLLKQCEAEAGGADGPADRRVRCLNHYIMTAMVASQMGELEIAENNSNIAVALAEAELGEESEMRGLAYLMRSTSLGAMGRHRESIEPAQRALTIFELVYPSASPSMIPPLKTLASAYQQVGDYDRATAYIERAVSVAEDVSDRLSLSRVHARILNSSGSPAEAAAMLEGVLAEAKGPIADDNFELLAAKAELAASYVRLSRAEDAVAMLEPLIEPLRRSFGDSPVLSMMLNGLGEAYYRASRLQEAERYFRETLSLRLKAGVGPELLMLAYNNLGLVLLEQGRFADSFAMLDKAREMSDEIDGNMEFKANLFANIATVARALGMTREAIELHRAAFVIVRQIHGARHPEVAKMQANFGQALIESGEVEEGRTQLEASYAMARSLGQGALSTEAGAAISRARTAIELEDVTTARRWNERAYSSASRAFVPQSPYRIAQLYFWGAFENGRGENPALARTLFLRAAEGVGLRIAGYTDFDAAAQNEMRQFSAVFRDQVKANWALQNDR